MAKWILLAVAAGAASGLLNVGAALGSVLALMLSHLTLLPLFLSGLGIGVSGSALSGLVGALIVAGFAGPLAALVYAGANALPALVLCRQALLSRPLAGGAVQWYPGGLLLCWLIGMVAGLYCLVLGYFHLFHNGLTAAIEDAIKQFIAGLDSATPDGGMSAHNQDILLRAAPFVPGIAAAYYIMTIILNGALAQHLLRRSGRNLRPSIELAELSLPPQLLYVLAASAVVAMVSSALSPFAATLAFIVMVAYFLLGLAVVHAYLGGRANRGMALFSFYVMFILLMLLFSAVGLAVVGLGIVEQVIGLRRRFAGGADKEDE